MILFQKTEGEGGREELLPPLMQSKHKQINDKPLIDFSPENGQHTTNQISCFSKTEWLLMSIIYWQLFPQLWVETNKLGEERKIPPSTNRI